MDRHDQEPQDRNRLPVLMEVLGRRTLAPVDLFFFYIYMRDQQLAVNYLDFWLDVSQHMSLCRHYVRELRRSMLFDTPELDKAQSKRSSQLLDGFDLNDPASHSSSHEKSVHDQRVSAFMRSEAGHTHKSSDESGVEGSPAHSMTSQHSRRLRQSQEKLGAPEPPRPSFMSTPDMQTDSNSPGTNVARADIKASAERILFTFILPGSERQIVLPDSMVNRITRAIEEEGRDDPEVFDDAKDYVFQAMQRDAFPGFLEAKALGNLVPLDIVIRLIVGLLMLMGGFWGGFYMILTDQPRNIRCWVILPFTLGTYFVVSYQYKIDFLAAYVGYSEYTWMNWSRIREPFVRRLLLTRSTMALLVWAAVAVTLSVLFIFVPGTIF